jgi:hypothetical protein
VVPPGVSGSNGRVATTKQVPKADQQNLEAWKVAQEAIKNIEPHPNQPPQSAQPASPAHLELDTPTSSAHTVQPTSASDTKQAMDLSGLRGEINQIDAANVPLPLPEGDGIEGKGKGKARAGDDPLGPL